MDEIDLTTGSDPPDDADGGTGDAEEAEVSKNVSEGSSGPKREPDIGSDTAGGDAASADAVAEAETKEPAKNNDDATISSKEDDSTKASDTGGRKRSVSDLGDEEDGKEDDTKRSKLDTLTKGQDGRWIEMYDKLVDYKNVYGDCLVPNRFAPDAALGHWVSSQRRQFKSLQDAHGTSISAMTKERIAKLNEIGFDWETIDPRHVPWDSRYKELCEYVKQYGDCQVPTRWKENIQLSNWVSKQRHDYKLRQRGTSQRLSDERYKRLNDIGFVWEASNPDHTGENGKPLALPPAQPRRKGPIPIGAGGKSKSEGSTRNQGIYNTGSDSTNNKPQPDEGPDTEATQNALSASFLSNPNAILQAAGVNQMKLQLAGLFPGGVVGGNARVAPGGLLTLSLPGSGNVAFIPVMQQHQNMTTPQMAASTVAPYGMPGQNPMMVNNMMANNAGQNPMLANNAGQNPMLANNAGQNPMLANNAGQNPMMANNGSGPYMQHGAMPGVMHGHGMDHSGGSRGSFQHGMQAGMYPHMHPAAVNNRTQGNARAYEQNVNAAARPQGSSRPNEHNMHPAYGGSNRPHEHAMNAYGGSNRPPSRGGNRPQENPANVTSGSSRPTYEQQVNAQAQGGRSRPSDNRVVNVDSDTSPQSRQAAASRAGGGRRSTGGGGQRRSADPPEG